MRRDFALPGTRARYAPDRSYDIQHIKIAVDIDVEKRSIRGTCTLGFSPIGRPSGWLGLDAVELDIARVSSADRDLPFSHDGTSLCIDVSGAHADDRGQLVVAIDYSATPRRGLYFVGPDHGYPDKPVQVWSQGQDEDSRFWFPCFDSPHEKATSEVVATVPAGFFALSNGTLVADQTQGERRTMHWRLDTPHSCYLITLAAGELSELCDEWDGVLVRYYVAPGREDECRRSLGRTPEMLALFSRLFGVRYPYDKYAQVLVADFIFGGMENTTATTLIDTVLQDERAAIDFDCEDLVAHELAHQWFGDLITCRDWGQGWLNEGFATYAEYLWREHAHGRDSADVELTAWGERYFGEDADRYRRKVATRVYDEPIDIFDHHLYDKGGRVLHMLRQILGDQAFWASIGLYLQTHQGGSVDTRDLSLAVEAATGRVLDWFFEQWITEGAGHPELEVGYSWDSERKLARITVAQTHDVDSSTPLFRLPLTVRFRVGDTDRDVPLELTGPQQSFYVAIDGDSEPSQAIFDPGKALLARVKIDKGIQLLEAELESATLAVDRVDAAQELARRGGPQAARALVRALTSDPFWAVRAAAARGLGELGTTAARDALIAAVATTEHPKARRAVVRALGSFVHDELAADTLCQLIVSGDPSYFVEAEACLSLGKTRSPRARELLRAAAQRDSFLDVIRQNAYLGLAEARDDSALAMMHEATAYGRMPQGRRAALKALAQLVQGRRDRDARDARELAEQLLKDRDFRVQLAAIEAMGTIDDEAAVPALRAMVGRDLDGRLRRRAREVIRDLESGRRGEDKLTALRDELEELRKSQIALRERVELLEAAADRKSKHKKRDRDGQTKKTKKKR